MDFPERRRRECHVGASDLDRRKVNADDFERINRVAGAPLEHYRNLDPTCCRACIWLLISSATTPRTEISTAKSSATTGNKSRAGDLRYRFRK